MIFIETTAFTKQVSALLKPVEYQDLQMMLLVRPDAGSIIRGSGGIRKVRWSYRGGGKRGGVRVIYYWAVSEEKILMLMMYLKNVQDNLSPAQVRLLRSIVEDEYL